MQIELNGRPTAQLRFGVIIYIPPASDSCQELKTNAAGHKCTVKNNYK